MAKSIMIQGTMSNVGKSILTGGILRVLAQDGMNVCPFKSQNMALNSYITKDGLEMGRAQVMQAEAAGIEPDVAMNPILLKPTTDTGSQVIVNGEVQGVMSAVEYFRRKTEYIPTILEAYEKLSAQYDVIVIEGAGSPAEINLKQNDIVNMGLAKLVDAPVLLVGDIDRGGVFAQIVGTIALLEEEERARVKGTIINKFRGDKSILQPGLDMLTGRTQIPVCGVMPYFHLDIDDEDSLSERFQKKERHACLDIAVIRFPRMSNFTDFAPFESFDEVNVRYVTRAEEFGTPDAVFLPGTKSTIADLKWMRQNGLEAKVMRHAAKDKLVFGICGGYQMMGEWLEDPYGVESEAGTRVRGMGLLMTRTIFTREKRRSRVSVRFGQVSGLLRGLSGCEAEGYEIHMGRTEFGSPHRLAALCAEDGSERSEDGTWSDCAYGCYIHGLFDSAPVSAGIVRALLKEKGIDDRGVRGIDRKTYKEEQYDKLADLVRENIDMKMVMDIIRQGA